MGLYEAVRELQRAVAEFDGALDGIENQDVQGKWIELRKSLLELERWGGLEKVWSPTVLPVLEGIRETLNELWERVDTLALEIKNMKGEQDGPHERQDDKTLGKEEVSD